MTKLRIYTTSYHFYRNDQLNSIHDIPQYHVARSNYLEWRKNDKLHRFNGPTKIYGDGEMRWYENGKCIKVEKYKDD